MAIKYFPNRVYHKREGSFIDRQRALADSKTTSQHFDVAAAAVEFVVGNINAWKVNSVSLKFSNVVANRTYSLNIKSGRAVVEHMNDDLWFQGSTTNPRQLVLTPGFYDGTDLAAELKTQLDADQRFIDDGFAPFTVAYNNATGIFTVTPDAGTIKYINVNNQEVLGKRDSIAGHLFGFTTTTSSFAANVTSDLVVAGLDNVVPFFSQSGVTTQNVFNDDGQTLTEDQAIAVLIDKAGGALEVDISVTGNLIV